MTPTIVFVHLGTKLPKYLLDNVLRTKSLKEGLKVVLVHDKANSSANLEKLGVETFPFDPQSLSKLGILIPHLNHDPKFRNGYWQNTFNRLFAVGLYQAFNGNEKVIHVESDVVLFPNFPFEKFSKLKTLSWPRVSDQYDVASILYSPTAFAFREFLIELTRTAQSNYLTTDMQAMSKYAHDFPDKVLVLPTTPPHSDKTSSISGDTDAWDLFNGIFDGLVLGHWLTGQDPRNSWGIRTRYLVPLDSPLNYASSTFSVDEDNLLVDNLYPVFNLHVHSKNSGYFKLSNRTFLKREIMIVNNRLNQKQLVLFALFGFIKSHFFDYLRAALVLNNWFRLLERLRKQR